ncbi:GGDEF domain-containing protein [Paenibacillus wynnii]|uniref:GGDEF domain-containing protein n=1 Tax=Paenibacillus wynnii TaxID=268407 RepID=UPI0023E3C9CE|nr:sensor domain-containing diguanylate cyclase [Paenibacillus wynnii]
MLTAAPIDRENLFESMRDGVLVTDRFDMLIDYNRAAAEMIQGLGSAAIGKPLAQLFLPAGKDAVSYVMQSDPLLQEEREMEWSLGRQIDHAYRCNGAYSLQEKLTQLATIDSLTSIYNRTYFMELSRKRLAESAHTESPLSLILLDIDHFKSINDRYGHEEMLGGADQALYTSKRNGRNAVHISHGVGSSEFTLV